MTKQIIKLKEISQIDFDEPQINSDKLQNWVEQSKKTPFYLMGYSNLKPLIEVYQIKIS